MSHLFGTPRLQMDLVWSTEVVGLLRVTCRDTLIVFRSLCRVGRCSGFTYLGVIYKMGRCAFGFTVCPYYCSAWSAEFPSWMVAQSIPCTHYMDDRLTVGALKNKRGETFSV